MKVTKTPIGQVWLDTATIVAGDPAHIQERPDLCVTAVTGCDGIFPAYEMTIDGTRYLAIALENEITQEIFGNDPQS